MKEEYEESLRQHGSLSHSFRNVCGLTNIQKVLFFLQIFQELCLFYIQFLQFLSQSEHPSLHFLYSNEKRKEKKRNQIKKTVLQNEWAAKVTLPAFLYQPIYDQVSYLQQIFIVHPSLPPTSFHATLNCFYHHFTIFI